MDAAARDSEPHSIAEQRTITYGRTCSWTMAPQQTVPCWPDVLLLEPAGLLQ